jgi:DivIVA domain-containing protein
MPPAPDFLIALRGYDRTEVDSLIATALAAVESKNETTRSQALALLRDAAFTMRMRGYDRSQVHAYLDEIQAQLQA